MTKKTLGELETREGVNMCYPSSIIPKYILDYLPEEYRSTITAVIFDLCNEEIDEVWLTESLTPSEVTAEYRILDCYTFVFMSAYVLNRAIQKKITQ